MSLPFKSKIFHATATCKLGPSAVNVHGQNIELHNAHKTDLETMKVRPTKRTPLHQLSRVRQRPIHRLQTPRTRSRKFQTDSKLLQQHRQRRSVLRRKDFCWRFPRMLDHRDRRTCRRRRTSRQSSWVEQTTLQTPRMSLRLRRWLQRGLSFRRRERRRRRRTNPH